MDVIKKGVTLLSVILFCFTGIAQLTGGVETNSAWYIDDAKIKLQQTDAANRIRANSYLRLDYKLKNFTAGLQAESYLPKALLNYSANFKGANLGTYYLSYKNDSIGLAVTAGHFYEQFGSGLVLRTWEDRQLGIANSIAGGNIKYSPVKAITFTALYGRQRNGLGFDFTKGTIAAFNAEADLADLFKAKKIRYSAGFSYVNRFEKILNTAGLPQATVLTSVRAAVQKNGFSADIEYVFKTKDALVEFVNIRPELPFDGDALLVNMGYSKKGLGLNATLRRLENFAVYSQRNLARNSFNEGLLNYIPSLTKQYDYNLTNIYVYAAQPNITFDPGRNKAGEIGGQFDVIYQFKKQTPLGGKYGTNISLNYAQWYGLKGLYDAAGRRYKADFAGLGTKYYHEVSAEVRKKWNPAVSSVFTFLNQYYNTFYVEETVGAVNANTVVIENTVRAGKANSVRLVLQHQWANAGFKNWAGAQFEFNVKSSWSFFAIDLYNYGNAAAAKQIHYYNFGAVYKNGAARVQAGYGRQRGGLICVGGVCRFVPESAGLNLAVNYSF